MILFEIADTVLNVFHFVVCKKIVMICLALVKVSWYCSKILGVSKHKDKDL